jgi:hypothetical protein
METVELKSELHRLVDELDNPLILDDYIESMKKMIAVSKQNFGIR